MSNNQNFQPLTPQLGIAGSSYQLEMGKVNNFWAIRLVKARDVLASKVYKDTPSPEELPLGNHLTGWVLSVLAIPNINTYQIQKTIGFLRQKALRNLEEQKLAKKTAGKSERTSVKLEKVPENVQVKRHQASGFVKEQKSISEADKKIAAELSPALAASNQTAASRDDHVMAVGKREFAKIPKGGGFVPQPFKLQTGKAVASKPVISAKVASRLKANIEHDMETKLESNFHKMEAQIETQVEAKLDKIRDSIFDSTILKDIVKRMEQLENQINKLGKENQELRSLVKDLSA